MKIASFFSGAGGLDLGFTNAGFELAYANDNWKGCWETFENNHGIKIDKRSIIDVKPEEIPDVVGFIGGPPCQSWSEAGAQRGIADKRGKLFFEYIRVLKDKKPLFFLAENVSGILHAKHKEALKTIIQQFKDAGYIVRHALLNVKCYGIPQDRKRVFFVGYHEKMNRSFSFFTNTKISTLKDAIWDLKDNAKPARDKNKTNGNLAVANHEYMNGGFSTIYMSRNRVRKWNEQSFTIQAGGRHAPIHPQAPKMEFVEKNKRRFVPGKEHLYRRLSVRECARIQTFPDTFIFKYNSIADGYKMVGNAVPVGFAKILAEHIYKDIQGYYKQTKKAHKNAR